MMLIPLLSCEKESINPLIGWWRLQSYETTYFKDLPKTTENIDSVEFIDCMEDFIHFSFSENGTGTMYLKGALEYSFTWNTAENNLSIIKDNETDILEYDFQIIEDLFLYTNEGVYFSGYWTCLNTAIRGK